MDVSNYRIIFVDSPKLTNKQVAKSKASQRKIQQKPIKKSTHNIVVVKQANSGPNVEKDPDILRLQVNLITNNSWN